VGRCEGVSGVLRSLGSGSRRVDWLGVYRDHLEAMKDRDEKSRLAQKYEYPTARFSEAVKELRRQMGNVAQTRVWPA
jgi:hypothetical protein